MGVLELLLALTIIAVVVFLASGLVTVASDDPAARRRSNLFMRARVVSQGVAIVLLALLVYFQA